MSEINFKPEFSGLEGDINHIDLRLDRINGNIVLLQTNVDRLTQLILQASAQDKSKFYSVQSDILRTLSLYNDNYQRLLELKFKYRSEHNDFKMKTTRFTEIELKKNLEEADVSYNTVLVALNKLSQNLNPDVQKFQLGFEKDEEL
jgi:hypothetical protein